MNTFEQLLLLILFFICVYCFISVFSRYNVSAFISLTKQDKISIIKEMFAFLQVVFHMVKPRCKTNRSMMVTTPQFYN